MDAGQVNEVVDKLAEKMGVAVDKIVPIAGETVQQVANRGFLLAGFGFILLVFCVTGIVVGMKYLLGHHEVRPKTRLTREDAEDIGFVCVIIGLFVATIAIYVIFAGLSQYVAPIPYLLGK